MRKALTVVHRLFLALALTASAACSTGIAYAAPAPFTALAVDAIPGDPLSAANPQTGDVDQSGSADDVYRFYLEAGQQVQFTLNVSDELADVDLYLYGPAADDLGDPPVASATGAAYPKALPYTATTSGYHNIDVRASTGTSDYTLDWLVLAGPNDDIAGASAIPASPVSGWLDEPYDADDVFRISLEAGEKVDVSLWVDPLQASPDADFNLHLFGPGATTVHGTAGLVAEAATDANPEVLTYTAASSGTYYLDVRAAMGSGPYAATYSLDPPDDIDGKAATASPLAGTLDSSSDPADVYRISLSARNRISVTLTGDPGTDFGVQLFAPGSTSIYVDTPVADHASGDFPYTVPTGQAGTYYLAVTANGGTGAYSLAYTVAAGEANDDLPAGVLPASPLTGAGYSLTTVTDEYDVYYKVLEAGQTFNVSMTGAGGTDFDLQLFGPTAVSVRTSAPVLEAITGDYPERLTYSVPATGRYYLAVENRTGSGSGTYTLAWSITQPPAALDIPGIAVPTSPPALGFLDAAEHPADVYRISLSARNRISITLTGDPGTDFGVQLFAPGSTSIYVDTPVADNAAGDFPYTVPAGQAGTYYLAVTANGGTGAYSLAYTVAPGATDDDIPGSALPVSPVNSSLTAITDEYDVYYKDLVAGQTFNVSMTGAGGTDFDLQLFAPGAVSVRTSTPVLEAITGDYPETLTYAVPATGRYYLAVENHTGSGSGTYTLTWSITQPPAALDIPGVAPGISPVTGTLDGGTHPADVFYIDLTVRQRLTLTLTGQAGTDFDVQLFAPGPEQRLATATPVDSTESGTYPKTFIYAVPNGLPGRYYMAVRCNGGDGTYSLTFSEATGATDDDIPGSALAASPVNSSLNASTDQYDVYYKDLTVGQVLNLSVTGAVADADLQVFGPTAVSVRTSTPLAEARSGAYPEELSFVAPATGRYYTAVEVLTGSGSGTYSLTWSITQPAAAIDIPGIADASPVSAALDGSHTDDVYYIDLAAKERLAVTLTGQPGFDVQLFAPGPGQRLATAVPIAELGLDQFPYIVPAGSAGRYYLAVRSNGATGAYTLTYTITAGAADDDIGGVVLPASPVAGSLNASTDQYDVYYKDLTAGQTIVLTLTGAAGTDFDLQVFGPTAVSVRTSTPLADPRSGVYPETFTFVAPTAGRYYIAVEVFTGSGSGTYSLAYGGAVTTVLRPVYRFYNLRTGVHFYTASETEKEYVQATYPTIYRFEGVAYNINVANPANNAPLFRFYNVKKGVHFYTASVTERDYVRSTYSTIYRYEGPAYNVSNSSAGGAVTVYRFYNLKQGVHFYTASVTERDYVRSAFSNVYRYEGASYYLAP